jgi:Kdo2-lipid IVA lauroyltransferase/acyltransferase
MGRDGQYDRFKKQKSVRLKKIRHWLEFWLLVACQRFAAFWTYRQNQRFGSALGRLAYRLAKKDVGIARYQLGFAFPELSISEREIILHQTFENVGQTFFETLIIERIRRHPERYIRLENTDAIHQSLKSGKGLVLLFAHVGNWELLLLICEMLGVRGIAIESSIGDDRLEALLLSVRKSNNINIIPRGDPKLSRAILSCFRRNEVLLIAIDQDTRVKFIYVDFFKRKAATARGAAAFAQRFQAPVISAFGARTEDGTHHYRFELLSQAPYPKNESETKSLTQHYTTMLEAHIRQYPAQWVWFHRRWKNQPDEIEDEVILDLPVQSRHKEPS